MLCVFVCALSQGLAVNAEHYTAVDDALAMILGHPTFSDITEVVRVKS